jgi:hypothetical protein
MTKKPGSGFAEGSQAGYGVGVAVDRHSPRGWLEGFEQFTVPHWDGEEAAPVAIDDLTFARDLLDHIGACLPGDPDAAPGADGSICMEWVSPTGAKKIFVDVAPGDTVLTYSRLGNAPAAERHFNKDDPALIVHLYDLFDCFATG